MQVKQYLQKVFNLNQERKRLKEDYLLMKEILANLEGNMMVPHEGDVLSLAVSHKIDLANAEVQKRLEIIKAKHVLTQEILNLKNYELEALLIMRYVICRKWQDIAEFFESDLQKVWQLHGEALRAFEQMLQQKAS